MMLVIDRCYHVDKSSSNILRKDAAEAFQKASSAFKLTGDYEKAGDTSLKASENFLLADASPNDTINSIVEAGNCFKIGGFHDKAIIAFRRAIESYKDSQRYGQCAKYSKEVAEIYEASSNMEGALRSYQEAAHYFKVDNKKSQASQINLKLATMITTHGEQYTDAANIFEIAGCESLESRLGQFSAKNHFFQCLLCHLASGDNVQVRQKIAAFKEKDHTFSTCRECIFAEKILEAQENYDMEAFQVAVDEFNLITPLDPWKVSVLLKAKGHTGGDTAGEEDVDLT